MADPLFDIRDHVAVVTGSTSGIGRALAEALARSGAKGVLNGLGDAAAARAIRARPPP